MKAYAKVVAYAIVATIGLAIFTRNLGYNMIGYDLGTNVLFGAIFGGFVGAVAGLPSMAWSWFRKFEPTLVVAAAVSLLFWLLECLALPGTNSGISWTHGEHVVLIGLFLGVVMWLARKYRC